MARFRIKKRSKGPPAPVEINVTPMIDMFSMLNSFLLMTAVFSATGQIRIEVPFLSSKTPPTKQEVEKDPQKVVTLILENEKMVLEVGLSNNSTKVEKDEFKTDPAGLDLLQEKLYKLRTEDPRFDKVTVMTELDTKYDILIQVLDSMRELKPGRAPIPIPAGYKLPVGVDQNALIPKIVLGNVIL